MTTIWVCGMCACVTTRCYCIGPSPMNIESTKWEKLKSKYSQKELQKITRNVLVNLVMKKKTEKEVQKIRQSDADFWMLQKLKSY
jgi:predicted Fe-S protein YdhL (DUF1289 family)